jgi:hypothetical protein
MLLDLLREVPPDEPADGGSRPVSRPAGVRRGSCHGRVGRRSRLDPDAVRDGALDGRAQFRETSSSSLNGSCTTGACELAQSGVDSSMCLCLTLSGVLHTCSRYQEKRWRRGLKSATHVAHGVTVLLESFLVRVIDGLAEISADCLENINISMHHRRRRTYDMPTCVYAISHLDQLIAHNQRASARHTITRTLLRLCRARWLGRGPSLSSAAETRLQWLLATHRFTDIASSRAPDLHSKQRAQGAGRPGVQ